MNIDRLLETHLLLPFVTATFAQTPLIHHSINQQLFFYGKSCHSHALIWAFISGSSSANATWVPYAHYPRAHSWMHMDDYKTGLWVASQAEVISKQTLKYFLLAYFW